MRVSSYNILTSLTEKEYLLVHGYSGAMDLVDENTAMILERNGEVSPELFQQEDYDYLVERGYLTQKTKDEEILKILEIGNTIWNFSTSPERVSSYNFMIIPTYNCNFRCSYCYEKKLLHNGKDYMLTMMDKEMVDKAFATMEQICTNPEKTKNIVLYGGDPLMEENRKIIEYIVIKGKKLGYIFRAVTNGYDLNHFMDLIGPDKIELLQITIDGEKPVHDRRRVHYSGNSSFDKITANITEALKTGVIINVRMNIDNQNIQHIQSIMELAKEKKWFDYQCRIAPAHIRYCEPEKFVSQSEIDVFVREKDMAKTLRSGQHAVYHIIRNALQKEDLIPYRATYCAANVEHYIFDPFGNLYTCWDHVGEDDEKIGQYYPEFKLDTCAQNEWFNEIGIKQNDCLNCKYILFCGGGCSRLRRLKMKFACEDFGNIFANCAKNAYKDVVNL